MRRRGGGEAAGRDPAGAIAYVNLARIAVERACLDGMELAQRALGLQAFVETNPVAQLCRDLAVYLRQPAPDEVLVNAARHGFRARGVSMNAARAHAKWRSLPFASLSQIVGPGAPLILAPHQDDESLGCGGLIAACAARGTPPVVAFLTDGALSHPGSRSHPPASLSRLRAREARVALQRLGVRRAVFLNAPDGAAPMAGETFNALRATLVRLARGCGAVVTAWRGDPHCDHVAAARLAADVAARTGLKLVSYPVWGWELPDQAEVPASAGRRLRVTAGLGAKRRAIAAHASQHGRVIHDDPTGFRLPASLLAALTGPYEVYLR